MIDDEPTFIKGIIDRLIIEGFEEKDIIPCFQVEAGFNALRSESQNIVCVSLDLLIGDNMNVLKGDYEINGLKALAQIRRQYRNIPIVCFSILSEADGEIREAMKTYNAKFIGKTDDGGTEDLIEYFSKCYGKR